METTIQLTENEIMLLREAIADMRESNSSDMMHFNEVAAMFEDESKPYEFLTYAKDSANQAAENVMACNLLLAKILIA